MRKRILCFGDSNTWGYMPVGGKRFDEDARWPMVMQAALGDAYRVIEEGLNGRTFSMDDPNEGGFKSGMAYLPACLMTHTPLDLVIVMLGTNDAKERFGLNAHTIAGNLEQFCALTRLYAQDAAGGASRILIVSPIHIGENLSQSTMYPSFGDRSIAVSRGFAKEYENYARALKCAYFNAASVAQPSKTDAIHMTKEGQRALGGALAQAVSNLFADGAQG